MAFPCTTTAVMLMIASCFLPGHAADTERDAHCTRPPPGSEKMIRGVDITRLDLVPLEMVGNNGFMSPVLKFSCNQGRLWRHPGGQEYQQPDQIWHITTLPGGQLSVDVSLYKTYNDIRRTLTREVGGSGTLWNFAFSGSYSYKKMQNTITNTSRYICDSASFESATRADVNPGWGMDMDPFAQKFVDLKLNGSFEANPGPYNRFIKEFGTHYFASANFGGYIRSVLETSTKYFYTKSDSDAQANAKISFLNILSISGGQSTATGKSDENFLNSTTQTVRYYGGDTNLLANQGLSSWQPTVEIDPWLFSGHLKPISDLIGDDTKREAMAQAVENYVMRTFLDEQERLIHTARSKVDDDVLTSLKARIDEMKRKVLLDETEVETLGREVEEQFQVPDWFVSNTNFCFKWWADGNEKQCGGGVANTLCAKPNTMTDVYRDTTDTRGGGCRMQWGIHSMGYPAWFNQVRVCFQWSADGDGGQCGGGAEPLLCAGVNEFSPEYRDDTDNRPGGCIMQWKLEVPSSAPLWMKTARMCFSWYHDGDSGQCTAKTRNMCAIANQWTEVYREDTDNRSGGCRMSWGIKLLF